MYKRVSDSYLFQKSDEKIPMHALYHGELSIQRCQGLNRVESFDNSLWCMLRCSTLYMFEHCIILLGKLQNNLPLMLIY